MYTREPIGRHERSPFAPGPQDREAVKLMAAQRVQPYQGRHRG